MSRQCITGAIALLTLALTACQQAETTDGTCHIYGTVNNRFEGKKIFLVPMNRPTTAETVDSTVITDGKFEFTADTCEMKVIRLDYHYRFGVQDLLVVTEPGNLTVTIDSVSSCKGTPQNDSLQAWKERTERFSMECAPFRIEGCNAERAGNTAVAETMKAKVDSIRRAYRKASHEMGESMKDTPLGEFLLGRFPKTYKQKMPDGSIKEMPFF